MKTATAMHRLRSDLWQQLCVEGFHFFVPPAIVGLLQIIVVSVFAPDFILAEEFGKGIVAVCTF